MQIEAEGATLNYEISGDSSNPALVLWHGAGCTLRMWDTALKGLKDSFENDYLLNSNKELDFTSDQLLIGT